MDRCLDAWIDLDRIVNYGDNGWVDVVRRILNRSTSEDKVSGWMDGGGVRFE